MDAQKIIPGGVNSPVRAFKSVGMEHPLFITKGEGSRVWDADGNSYIDYVGSWGPLILGHRHPEVVQALHACLDDIGTSFGAPTELESKMAELVLEAFPSMEMVRMVNSGTEATMSALRLARGYTGRDKIVKFEGCYHGHADHLLIKAGSGALTLGIPTSPGVPANIAGNTINARFNDIENVKEIFKLEGNNIAAVIVEPVPGNMGCVPPLPGFLQGLRQITEEYGALLVFDEVMTGFRVAYGGAQALYGIDPDLTCLGKIIGGGLPVGAYGGKEKIMSMMAPKGPVYQAGTLSGNPLAMTAGITTLTILKNPMIYHELEKNGIYLEKGLVDAAKAAGVNIFFTRVGSMFSGFFTDRQVNDYASALTSDVGMFNAYFKLMLEFGVYLAPSQFEAGFLSIAHAQEDLDWTIEATKKALMRLPL
jgi:glutamate-1-semialdehyde 2,1-aminomutase